ncbi:hypothetical protein SEVIR_2G128000v4 [Setaria viridis]
MHECWLPSQSASLCSWSTWPPSPSLAPASTRPGAWAPPSSTTRTSHGMTTGSSGSAPSPARPSRRSTTSTSSGPAPSRPSAPSGATHETSLQNYRESCSQRLLRVRVEAMAIDALWGE